MTRLPRRCRAAKSMVSVRVIVVAAVAVACSAAACTRDRGAPEDLLTSGKAEYSQFNEELVIRHFFDDRRDGFYVDVGAYHWFDNSTTAYLDRHLGWSGIAVDAQASFAEGWQEHRPRAKYFSYIVTDHAGTKEPFYLALALSSTNPDHVARITGDASKELKRIEVETITLTDLLDREGVERIDLLSMDIEGGEPKALAGFDIARFRPELVCIEAGPTLVERREQIAEYFAEHGYRRLDEYAEVDQLNWYFTPAN